MRNELTLSRHVRRVFRGSFLLSAGEDEGHIDISKLLAVFLGLKSRGIRTRADIFGVDEPSLEVINMPNNHIEISPEKWHEENLRIWHLFLDNLSGEYNVIPQIIVRNLVELNAKTDTKYFGRRLDGKGVPLSREVAPSLLRLFIVEEKFPYIHDQFYAQLVKDMNNEIRRAITNSYTDTPHLSELVKQWNEYYEETPFMTS